MKDIDYNLLQIRLISFLHEAGTLIVVALLGVFSSPAFAEIVMANLGTGVFSSVALLAITGLVKHIRNKMKLKKLGSSGKKPLLI